MNVRWKKIEKSPNYSVSSQGQVRNDKTGRILKPSKFGDTYRYYLPLWVKRPNGDKRVWTTVYIHRLVAEAFIPNKKNLPDVGHLDGDKSNNKVSNLKWTYFHAGRYAIRPVRIIQTGQVFPSVNACEKFLGLRSAGLVSRVIDPRYYNKSAKGYTFEYVEA